MTIEPDHKMPFRPSRRAVTTVGAAAPLGVLLAGNAAAAPPDHSNAGGRFAPSVEARVKPILTRGKSEFRDLNGNGEIDDYENWRLPTKKRVADLLSKMTVEEKAGLLLISSFDEEESKSALANNQRHFIVRDDPEPSDLAARNNSFQELGEASRLGIPVAMTSNPRNHLNLNSTLGHVEAGGQISTWPNELGLAAAKDPAMIREFAEIAAKEWRATGMHKLYGYMADVLTEARWTRANGTFGEDVDLVTEYIREIVRGFQGKEITAESVAMTIKHFAGGGPRVDGTDPHHAWGSTNEYPTEGSLYDYHLPPFQAAIDTGTSSVMPYYAKPVNAPSAPQLPEHLWYSPSEEFEEVAFAYNERLLQGLLRDEMGFTGYINSDTGIINNMIWGVEDLSEPERYAKALDAGTAIFSGDSDQTSLRDAIDAGLVTEEMMDRALSSTLAEMFDLGLFENPYVDPERAQVIGDDPDSQARADLAHRRSVVLLRNDQDALPLTDAAVEEIKLYVEIFQKEDSAEASEDLAESFRQIDPSITIVTEPADATHAYLWVLPSLSWREDDTEGSPPSILLRKDHDTGIDHERIIALQQQVETTILAVDYTNPWIVDEIEPGADAVLATFNTTPDAVIDILRGRFAPTGSMPFTVPASLEAVDAKASDIPGWAAGDEYAYVDAAGNPWTLWHGQSY